MFLKLVEEIIDISLLIQVCSQYILMRNSNGNTPTQRKYNEVVGIQMVLKLLKELALEFVDLVPNVNC